MKQFEFEVLHPLHVEKAGDVLKAEFYEIWKAIVRHFAMSVTLLEDETAEEWRDSWSRDEHGKAAWVPGAVAAECTVGGHQKWWHFKFNSFWNSCRTPNTKHTQKKAKRDAIHLIQVTARRLSPWQLILKRFNEDIVAEFTALILKP